MYYFLIAIVPRGPLAPRTIVPSDVIHAVIIYLAPDSLVRYTMLPHYTTRVLLFPCTWNLVRHTTLDSGRKCKDRLDGDVGRYIPGQIGTWYAVRGNL